MSVSPRYRFVDSFVLLVVMGLVGLVLFGVGTSRHRRSSELDGSLFSQQLLTPAAYVQSGDGLTADDLIDQAARNEETMRRSQNRRHRQERRFREGEEFNPDGTN